MSFLAQTYNYHYGGGYRGSESEAGAALAGFMTVVIFVGIFLYAIPAIITTWKLFQKAGHPGWNAIVPIYGAYIWCKIAGVSTGVIVAYFVTAFLSAIPVVGLFVSILSAAITLYILFHFAKKYDQDVGFWLLYIFLPIITIFMVGKVKYIGTAAVSADSPAAGQPAQAAAPKPIVAPVQSPEVSVAPQSAASSDQDNPASTPVSSGETSSSSEVPPESQDQADKS